MALSTIYSSQHVILVFLLFLFLHVRHLLQTVVLYSATTVFVVEETFQLEILSKLGEVLQLLLPDLHLPEVDVVQQGLGLRDGNTLRDK